MFQASHRFIAASVRLRGRERERAHSKRTESASVSVRVTMFNGCQKPFSVYRLD